VSVEGNTQQGNCQYEGDGHAHLVLFRVAFVYSPDDGSCQYNDVNHYTAVEGHSQCIYEEQFEPASYFYNTRYHAIKYGGNQNARSEQCQ